MNKMVSTKVEKQWNGTFCNCSFSTNETYAFLQICGVIQFKQKLCTWSRTNPTTEKCTLLEFHRLVQK
eukprot:1970070-Amphidinium_carterae.2